MCKDTLSVKQCIVQLFPDRPLAPSARSHHLRGAVGSLFPDEKEFHQHEADGSIVYNYPLIQYKIIRGNIFLTGLGKGAESLADLRLIGTSLVLGKEEYAVSRQEISYATAEIGCCFSHFAYRFSTPWLALNEKNYEIYQCIGDFTRRKKMLARILTGNLLSMSKGLGYTVRNPIKTEFPEIREVKTKLKGIPMLAFTGIFAVNFHIPEYWGIGKSASRGFGTVNNLLNSANWESDGKFFRQ